ncbi:MAG: hypothetical protein AB1450_08110 [Pseudomonadota bacterium]
MNRFMVHQHRRPVFNPGHIALDVNPVNEAAEEVAQLLRVLCRLDNIHQHGAHHRDLLRSDQNLGRCLGLEVGELLLQPFGFVVVRTQAAGHVAQVWGVLSV